MNTIMKPQNCCHIIMLALFCCYTKSVYQCIMIYMCLNGLIYQIRMGFLLLYILMLLYILSSYSCSLLLLIYLLYIVCISIYMLVVPIYGHFLCRDNLLSPFSQNVDKLPFQLRMGHSHVKKISKGHAQFFREFVHDLCYFS